MGDAVLLKVSGGPILHTTHRAKKLILIDRRHHPVMSCDIDSLYHGGVLHQANSLGCVQLTRALLNGAFEAFLWSTKDDSVGTWKANVMWRVSNRAAIQLHYP